MDLNPASIVMSILFSIVGLGYFVYGRKQQKFVPLVVGIALGIFPYFISNVYAIFFVGAGLVAMPILFRE